MRPAPSHGASRRRVRLIKAAAFLTTLGLVLGMSREPLLVALGALAAVTALTCFIRAHRLERP